MISIFHIVVCRKPISEGTVAQNVVRHGTGGLNIDGCRVWTRDKWNQSTRGPSDSIGTFKTKTRTTEQHNQGRFPANIIHDNSIEVVSEFPYSTSTGGSGEASMGALGKTKYGKFALNVKGANIGGLGDSGSAARFFKKIIT